MASVRMVQRLAEGLVKIRFDGDTALWAQAKLRKSTRCAATGSALKPGDMAYRPLENQMYRSSRVAASWVEQYPLPIETSDG